MGGEQVKVLSSAFRQYMPPLTTTYVLLCQAKQTLCGNVGQVRFQLSTYIIRT